MPHGSNMKPIIIILLTTILLVECQNDKSPETKNSKLEEVKEILSEDKTIDGINYKAGSEVAFYKESDKVKEGFLAEDQTINGVIFKAGILL